MKRYFLFARCDFTQTSWKYIRKMNHFTVLLPLFNDFHNSYIFYVILSFWSKNSDIFQMFAKTTWLNTIQDNLICKLWAYNSRENKNNQIKAKWNCMYSTRNHLNRRRKKKKNQRHQNFKFINVNIEKSSVRSVKHMK